MGLQSFHTRLLCFVIAVCSSVSVHAQQSVNALQSSLASNISTAAKADICFTISRKYADGLKIDSALYFAERIHDLSKKDGYTTGIGKYHLALSIAQLYRSKVADAKMNVAKAVKIFTGKKDVNFLGIAYWQQGTIAYWERDMDASRKFYWSATALLQNAADDHNLYRNYFWLARTFELTSDYDSVAYYYFKSLTLAEKLKDEFKIFTAACDLGEAFLDLRNFPKAYQYLHYGLQKKPVVAKEVDLWLRLNNYTVSLINLHQFARADSAIRQFEIAAKHFNNGWGWLTLSKLKGVQAYEKQNYIEAVNHLADAYRGTHTVALNSTQLKFIVLSLAKAEFRAEQYDSAIVHLAIASDLAIKSKAFLDAQESDLLLSRAFEKLNKPDSALRYFQRYSHIKESVFSMERQNMITEVTARYESEKKEQLISILEKETEASSYLLLLKNQQIEKQLLESDKRSQQLTLISQQNEINKLDAAGKTLSFENERKENEKNQVKLNLLEKEASYQKLLATKEDQQKKDIYGAIVALLLISGFVLQRYIRKKRFQNEQRVLNERLRISRELHDEVGSTLSGIAMFSYLTREQMKADKMEDVDKSLNNIQQSASEMVEKLSDIIWLVNPDKDPIKKLLERLEQYAEDMAAVKGIEVKMNISQRVTNINLPVEMRRNIYLFCKEAINNAVKYSEAKLIKLDMDETENRRIEISIADDGKGFDIERVRNGNGLTNMRQRAIDIGGEYLMQTKPGSGTKISCIFKIT